MKVITLDFKNLSEAPENIRQDVFNVYSIIWKWFFCEFGEKTDYDGREIRLINAVKKNLTEEECKKQINNRFIDIQDLEYEVSVNANNKKETMEWIVKNIKCGFFDIDVPYGQYGFDNPIEQHRRIKEMCEQNCSNCCCEGSNETVSNAMIRFGRNRKGNRKNTLVTIKSGENKFCYGIARCSSKDKFNRNLGIEIAFGRALSVSYDDNENWIAEDRGVVNKEDLQYVKKMFYNLDE